MMAAVRSSGNRAEVALRKELYARGLRYRIYYSKLIGRPDIVFVGAKLAVFVDGDFWHGRRLLDGGVRALRQQVRGARQGWWLAKLRRTAERDAKITRELRKSGWAVLRYWESDVLAHTHRIADRVQRAVSRRIKPT